MRYVIITDHNVEQLYGRQLQQTYDAQLFSFPAGESSKTRATKERLEDELLSAGYSRDTTIVALGGGVVNDLAGFLAATYCRGVGLILIPTTLLAMVDASIGGKTGVNTPHAKNMIGAFYEPIKTVIDLSYLATLPEKEWFNGKVEMLKAGLIADADFFHQFSTIPIELAIERARAIKKRIVEADPFEKGVRRMLNLGHTLGHALETLSDYKISHGEAVAAGIVLEAEIAHSLGILKSSDLDLIKSKFPPVNLELDPDQLLGILQLDKKSIDGKSRFILLTEIGAVIEKEVPYTVIYDAVMCSR
jgi:3-dehydroquinate synthase